MGERPRRPRIGLSLDLGAPDEQRRVFEISSDYVAAIERAGGMPVLLAQTADHELRLEMIESIDGLIIPGGRDIDPALYGQAVHGKTRLVDKARETFDLALLALAEARGVPTLGICLGCQLMNVYRRGTLHQHLPEVDLGGGVGALAHSEPGNHTNFHELTLGPGSRLAAIYGASPIRANSRHHQGIAKVGHGLVASARAADGLVEGIEDPSLPCWLAVQWHPENLGGTEHDKLFLYLVGAARQRRAK